MYSLGSIVQCTVGVLLLLHVTPSSCYSRRCSSRCTSSADLILDRVMGANFTFMPCEGTCSLCRNGFDPEIKSVSDAGDDQFCTRHEVQCGFVKKNNLALEAARNAHGGMEPGEYQFNLKVEWLCRARLHSYKKTNFIVPVELRVFEVSLISYHGSQSASEDQTKLLCMLDGPVSPGSEVVMYFMCNSSLLNCSTQAMDATVEGDYGHEITTRRLNRRSCELEISSTTEITSRRCSCSVLVVRMEEKILLSSPEVIVIIPIGSAPPSRRPQTGNSSTLSSIGFGLSGCLLVVWLAVFVALLVSCKSNRYPNQPDDHHRLLPEHRAPCQQDYGAVMQNSGGSNDSQPSNRVRLGSGGGESEATNV